MDINVLDIPRFDASDEQRGDFLHGLASQANGQIVLTTIFWPPGHLESRWFAWLTEVLDEAHRVFSGPITLAELTSEMFDDIVATKPEAIMNATGELVDQVFKHHGAEVVPKKKLHQLLDDRGLVLIAGKMYQLGLVEKTHIELRNGWHTDHEIKFGSFGSVAGGDGFVRYLAARLARKLAMRKPKVELIAYWTDPVRHETFPNIMNQLSVQLARRDVYPNFLQLEGSAAEPTVPAGAAPQAGGVVLAADVLASTSHVHAAYEVLRRANIFPEVIAPLIAYSFTPKMKFHGNVNMIAPAIVKAERWKSRSECRQEGPPVLVDTEARVALPEEGSDSRFIAKGPFWNLMLLNGKVGHAADGDTRHLHHTYVQPGTRPHHLDQLLHGVVDHLRKEQAKEQHFALVYADNKLCDAIVGRLKAHCVEPFQTYKARKVHGIWRIGSLKSAIEKGLRIVVLDDGSTTGLSLLHLCDLIHSSSKLPISAAIVVEDKRDATMRRVIDAMANSKAWGQETSLFFLHRSPPAPPSFVEGECSTCEELNLLGAVTADRPPRPAFVAAATADLQQEIVWDASQQQHEVDPVTMGDGYPIAYQYNSLLASHPQLRSSPAMMDVCIRDAIPQMRAERLAQSVEYLEPALRERVLLWLKPQDLEILAAIESPPFDLDLTTPGLRLSLILQRLGTARRREEFVAAAGDLMSFATDNPRLCEDRYRDVLQQLLRGLARSPSRATWIEASIRELETSTAPAMLALRDDLLHLNRAVPPIVRADSPAWGFDSRAGHVFQARLANVERLLRDHAYVLDLQRQPWTLWRRGGAKVELASVDAICWALAIIRKRQFTGDLTSFLKRVGLQAPGGQAQNQIDSVRRRCAKLGVGVVAVDRDHRDTPGRRVDNCIVRGADQGVILWRDDGSVLWKTFTRMALKEI